jgi:hypothetical protein
VNAERFGTDLSDFYTRMTLLKLDHLHALGLMRGHLTEATLPPESQVLHTKPRRVNAGHAPPIVPINVRRSPLSLAPKTRSAWRTDVSLFLIATVPAVARIARRSISPAADVERVGPVETLMYSFYK